MNPNPFAISAEKSVHPSPTPPAAPPPAVDPALAPTVAVAVVVPPASTSAGSFGTWNDAPPDATSGVRDAVRRLRRAHLSRVVRGVVVASSIVCLAALVRVGLQAASGDALQIDHPARVSMKPREAISTFVKIHDDDDLVAARPRAKVAREPHHAGRSTASRAHPTW